MADRIITVTTPSVVTDDTLSGYNNYSDIDGLLGSMTVGEAAAGKTVSLSDGVVHEVTTKPVGTTKVPPEFSTVISNAVTVDLSQSAVTLIYQSDFTANGTTGHAAQNAAAIEVVGGNLRTIKNSATSIVNGGFNTYNSAFIPPYNVSWSVDDVYYIEFDIVAIEGDLVNRTFLGSSAVPMSIGTYVTDDVTGSTAGSAGIITFQTNPYGDWTINTDYVDISEIRVYLRN